MGFQGLCQLLVHRITMPLTREALLPKLTLMHEGVANPPVWIQVASLLTCPLDVEGSGGTVR
jgi:hypothetical protein